MKIDILTLFPEMFAPLKQSIIGRAEEKGIIEINIVNIRDYSADKHKKTDDYPFGGGAGMVMSVQPIFDAMRAVCACGTAGETEGANSSDSVKTHAKRVIYMSPRGRVLDAEKVKELAGEEELVILCGHYEGVDQRVLDYFGAEEISIGDYILTGGELPAMVLVDSAARMLEGVLASEDAAFGESIYSGLLEYPQYTKPREYEGLAVPEVLVSGNHKLIALWQFEKSLELTKCRRPDLFETFIKNEQKINELGKEEKKILEKIIKNP
ncbi:MAG: tRNA (guanosine(37)-N1)-methyltransferase TrmD [Firmicutes bacterium]|nr:tRNA (guanosine(37)-N1)-methyltransferase TrmD [Bacillota bacterium]